MKWPFSKKEEEEQEVEEIPEGELCDECGERIAVWKTVENNTKLCNICQIDNKSHMTRILSSIRGEE